MNVASLRERLAGGLVARSGAVFVTRLLLIVTSMVTFYVLTQRLGSEGYGAYANAFALASILGPLAEIGCIHLSVYTRAKTGSLTRAWQENLGAHLFAGVSLLVFFLALQPLLAPDLDRTFLVLIAVAEGGLNGTVMGACTLAEAEGRPLVGTWLRVVGVVTRVVALVAFLVFDMGLMGWGWLNLVANAVTAFLAIVVMARVLHAKPGLKFIPRHDIRRGLGYAVNQLGSTVQSDADKAILGAYGETRATGIYSAGYRVVALGYLPVSSVEGATYGQFFEVGQRSVAEVRDMAWRLTRKTSVVTLPFVAGFVVLADVMADLLGSEFAETADVIRWLAVLPLLRSIQIFAANALTGSDHHRYRVGSLVIAASVNVVLNIIFIPAYTWKAAVATTLLAEVLFAILLWTALNRAVRKQRPHHDPDQIGEAISSWSALADRPVQLDS